MSSFAVKVEKILDVFPHSNADRLDVVQVLGWRCVVQKGSFQKGELCIYFPIDSILPPLVEDLIFPPDSKIKLTKSRVRTIKLRGEISQGLVVKPNTLIPAIDAYERRVGGHVYGAYESLEREGCDITDMLGVIKYEPPAPPPQMRGAAVSKKQINPHFAKYTDIENAKNYPDIFTHGELVHISEKIHGTNFRAGWAPTTANTLWKRILKAVMLLPQYEFVYGSRNVQMQHRYAGGNTTFYQQTGAVSENVYAEAVRKYDLKKKIPKGLIFYGEIYGHGIQAGYTYGCGHGERKLALFDVMDAVEERYLNPHWVGLFSRMHGIPQAPVIHEEIEFSPELVAQLREGDSLLHPAQKVREGIVVRPVEEAQCRIGRKILKFINDEYLLKDQSDFH